MAEMKARIVWVHREQGEAGLFYATSHELPGLLVAEKTLEELERAIPIAVADLYRASGTDVFVTKLEDDDDDLDPWVAVPADIARAALSDITQRSRL